MTELKSLQDAFNFDELKSFDERVNSALGKNATYCVEQKIDGLSEVFSYKDIKSLKSGLSGYYQVENVCIATEALKVLGIEEKYIRQGVLEAQNPGRFEVIKENPYLIYDGAHNSNGATALVSNLKRYFDKNHKFTFVCAFMADKGIDEILNILTEGGFKDRVTFNCTTVLNNERAMDEVTLCEKLTKRGFLATPFKNIKDALKNAEDKKEDTVIFGSLYLYKDYKTL